MIAFAKPIVPEPECCKCCADMSRPAGVKVTITSFPGPMCSNGAEEDAFLAAIGLNVANKFLPFVSKPTKITITIHPPD